MLSDGLNLQVLGHFDGTIDKFHLAPGDTEEHYKIGKKLKARIIYNITPSTPPKFALSLANHVLNFGSKTIPGESEDVNIEDAYSVGTIIDAVKVTRVETERGLVVEVIPGVQGFVHVRFLLCKK